MATARARTMTAVALLALAACSAPGGAPTTSGETESARPANSRPTADFNGDGYGDLALGASAGGVRGKDQAGGVIVLYGSAKGLDSARPQGLTRASAGVPGAVREVDAFGQGLASGDLDRDGYTDLVVCAMGWENAYGRPVVLWGGPRGLSGGTELKALNGKIASAPAVADFDGDGSPDIATLGTTSPVPDMGRSTLTVIHGPFRRSGHTGPVRTRDLQADPHDYLVGNNLAAADLVGDRRAELVIGGYRIYHADEESVHGTWLVGENTKGRLYRIARFKDGYQPATGDIDGDGRADLVLGDHHAGPEGSGQITVRYGGEHGFRADVATISELTSGVPGTGGSGDSFGATVALGDIDGDGRAEVAVGAPRDADVGTIAVFHGTAKGISTRGVREVSEAARDIPSHSGSTDAFGGGLLLADTSGDGHAELIVAAPYEDDGHGAVWFFPGGPGGLILSGVRHFRSTEHNELPVKGVFMLGQLMAG
ncbi:FG-GAP-like repeat-containing protein [Streptomyces ipomoeae]|uniref:FG-GAP-like repeat-containing protein n=1 Tax=Streptomyces ipomoeae TaxID=103232 RepID=UPI00114676CA|nr:FG-GAP and VCBS repeat-containing protein [Streptomyces ipomoeae]MDX2938649.1 FG-GAP and VCBS repeat-containing protein [Streptomyces ipomoeae]TQE18438.1 hypothetical protein SipoB123_34565 [Streptomyces ipomoeae]